MTPSARGATAVRWLATAVLAVALAASIVGCDDGSTEGADGTDGDGGGDALTVWTVNIKQLEYDWWRFMDSMRARGPAPDVVLVQEIPRDAVEDFDRRLQSDLGPDYASAYASGYNALFWRTDRLAIRNPNTSTAMADNLLLWKQWEGDACDQRVHEIVAARLWDRRAAENVVAVSTRWWIRSAKKCLTKNVTELNGALEARWPNRRLTVIGGDFNSHPDTRSSREGDALSAGRQADPDCWYRTLSAADGDRLEHARPGEDLDCTNDPHFADATNTYYDAVFLRNPDGICNQWTYTRALQATAGNACTDTNGDGLRDRSRLDFIWVRWEDANGAVELVPRSEAARRLGPSGADPVCADRSCDDTWYSDHRATWATIGW